MCPYNIVETGTPLEFLKQADAAGKIITYICHGAIPVAAADLIKGEKATGWQASKESIEIMGGEYNENWAAVVDGSQVSGRTPPEIPEHVDAIMVALVRGKQSRYHIFPDDIPIRLKSNCGVQRHHYSMFNVGRPRVHVLAQSC